LRYFTDPSRIEYKINWSGNAPTFHFTDQVGLADKLASLFLDSGSARGHSQTEPMEGVCSAFAHPSLNFSRFQSSQLWHLGASFESEEELMRYLKFLAYLPCCGFAEHSKLCSASGLCQYRSRTGCPYGYYDFAPYSCAPYGYYGPEWFSGGVFIGAGPWFHGPHDFHATLITVSIHITATKVHIRTVETKAFNHFHGNETRDGRGMQAEATQAEAITRNSDKSGPCGYALTFGGLVAVAMQTPAGAVIDAVHRKRCQISTITRL